MKESILQYIKCPNCNSRKLKIDDSLFSVKESEGVIVQGSIFCDTCTSSHPILLGLPILVKNQCDYFTKNKVELLLNLYKHEADKKIIEYINDMSAHSIYGHSSSQESWQSQEGIDTYIHNQYILKTNRGESSFMPPHDSYNFYSHISDLIKNEIQNTAGCLVDLGCGAGGMIHHLRDQYSVAIGLDYSFSAILAAQMIQEGVPFFKTTYNYYESAQRSITKNISCSNSKELHFLVADATNPPLENDIADMVTSINLLEIINNPSDLISSIRSILNNNGLMINSSPYYWRNDRSPKDEWLANNEENEPEVFLKHLSKTGFNILKNIDPLPWPLRFYSRYWQIWESHLVMAKKND